MAKRPQAPKPPKAAKNVEALRHTDDKRLNIPTAEHQSVLEAEHVAQKEIRYPRNTDLADWFPAATTWGPCCTMAAAAPTS